MDAKYTYLGVPQRIKQAEIPGNIFKAVKLSLGHKPGSCCFKWSVMMDDRHAWIPGLTISITVPVVCFCQGCNPSYQLICIDSLCMQKEFIFYSQVVKLYWGRHPRWDRLVYTFFNLCSTYGNLRYIELTNVKVDCVHGKGNNLYIQYKYVIDK